MLKQQKLKNGSIKVTFCLSTDEAPQAVSVVGGFNDWNALSHPLKKRSNGTRTASIELKAGEVIEFRYLDDGGRWFNEPDAGTNELGNCVLTL